ncbi:MAG: hypothetical protein AAGB00_05800 [Planctomycetota bacterium]
MNVRLFTPCIAALLVLAASDAFAQPGGGFGGRGFGGRGGDRPNPFGIGALLMSEDVRGEIELLEEQEQELRAMGEEMRDKMRSAFSGMRDLPREERRAAMEDARSEMESIRSEMESRVKEVLMPHQFERLQQIEVQQQMRRGGTASIASGRAADLLGLTDAQKEEMQKKAQEEQERLQAKIQELRAAARDEILTVLTPEQRAKYDELVGKPFEMQQGGGFGRGGFGGRRGGGQRGERPGGGSPGRPELE